MKNQIAVVVGGSSGIGEATARKLANLGARVVIFGRSESRLAEALERLGSSVEGILGDVQELDDIDCLMQHVSESYGRIDTLFINVGVTGYGSLEVETAESFDTMFGINVRGPYFCLQKAIPLLGKGASVIFNTSIANIMGAVDFSVYSATKGAVFSLMRTSSIELIKRGIFVNAVSPGFTISPILEKMGLDEEEIAKTRAKCADIIPVKRLAQPEEIADVVVFLALSKYMVGQEIVIDGGVSIALPS